MPSATEVRKPKHSLRTVGVAVKTTPTVLASFVKFMARHKKDKKDGKPTAELSYAEGLAIVKRFLDYASTHSVAELQAFTGHKIPTPSWVEKQVVHLPSDVIDRAAVILRKQLRADPSTVGLVGGENWWTARGRDLMCEYIEMKKQRITRKGKPAERILFYIHGGAHFFSSLETHRYQIVRHARKLNARAFAPAYRLSPQYGFPCALHDCLAAYLYLLDEGFPSHQILFSGDSSGAGLALVLLTLLRDQGLPLPSGATLISPWVDLAHSFPSIMSDPEGDYIPSRGFHYRPGLEWPPLKDTGNSVVLDGEDEPVILNEQMQMYTSNALLSHPMVSPVNQGSLGGLPPLYICAGSAELLRDEIIYIAHKAASPALYPPSPATLEAYPAQQKHLDAGYPPTLTQLQVFDDACHVATTLSITALAKYMYRGSANFGLWALTAAKKKAERLSAEGVEGHHHHHFHSHAHSIPHSHLNSRSNNSRSHSYHASHSGTNSTANSSPPTRSTTLSPTPAESTDNLTPSSRAENFEPLPLRDAREANEEEHDIADSESDTGSESSCSSIGTDDDVGNDATSASPPVVKVTGHLPAYTDSMIRQRVSVTGRLRPLEPANTLPATTMSPSSVGRLHTGPVRKWLAERVRYDEKYAKDLAYYREIRLADREKAIAGGFLQGKFVGENPPLASLAGWSDEKLALRCGQSVDEIGKKTNMALASWARISAEPDKEVVGGVKVSQVSTKLNELQVGPEGAELK